MKKISKTVLVNMFKARGFKLDDTETTAGASKAWMKGTGPEGFPWCYEKLVDIIRDVLKEAEEKFGSSCKCWLEEAPDDFTGAVFRTDAFTIETQTPQCCSHGHPGQIFIAVFAGRPRGWEYEMGVDC